MDERKTAPSLRQSTRPSWFVWVGIWFAVLCWGCAYVAARFLLIPQGADVVSLSPLMLAVLRFGIASLFFVIPLVLAIRHHEISGRNLFLMALLGQLTFTLYYWLQYIGIQETSAGISAILGVGLIPLFTTLLAPLFGRERWSIQLFSLLLLGFCGVALIVFQQPVAITLHSGFLLGAGCLLTNTFFFALYNHVSKHWLQDISPITFTAGTMTTGAVGLLLVSLVDPHSHWTNVGRLQLVQWVAVLFLAVACSVVAYFAYNVALHHLDASRVAVYFYVEPVIPLVLGVVLLGEHLSWQTVAGGLIIIGSVIAVNQLKPVVATDASSQRSGGENL